jgi:hypothetical protein
MSILKASFFWKNDQPGGIAVSFGPPTFSARDLEMMFEGDIAKKFMRDSDDALGSNIVNHMISQLTAVGEMRQRHESITSRTAILTALNIMWLTRRGFIPNDEFNGMQFIHHMLVQPPKGNPA